VPETARPGRSAALRIDIVTLFPEQFAGAFGSSIVSRAVQAGLVQVTLVDLRRFTPAPHHVVDDAPFGGGGGQVLKAEPLFLAVEAITGRPASQAAEDEAVVLLTPAGTPHDQPRARRFAALSRLVLLCGRYEGVDHRVRTHLATETLSLGDYVLSGGEPAAVAVVDSVVRLLPGALGNPESPSRESHEDGLLEAPHFTRPASFRSLDVPSVLLSGNHGEVARWRRRASLRLTASTRPDLIERARHAGALTPDDEAALAGEDAPLGSELSRTTR
jgi:tRNA (guanine37-N1)-methyltransferase